MIAVSNIETLRPGKTPPQGGRSAQHGKGAALQPVEATGRALATQRDAFYFRSAAILRQGAPATTPYLAQQISQMWPSAPAAVHKAAVHAYAQNGKLFEHDERRESVLA